MRDHADTHDAGLLRLVSTGSKRGKRRLRCTPHASAAPAAQGLAAHKGVWGEESSVNRSLPRTWLPTTSLGTRSSQWSGVGVYLRKNAPLRMLNRNKNKNRWKRSGEVSCELSPSFSKRRHVWECI